MSGFDWTMYGEPVARADGRPQPLLPVAVCAGLALFAMAGVANLASPDSISLKQAAHPAAGAPSHSHNQTQVDATSGRASGTLPFGAEGNGPDHPPAANRRLLDILGPGLGSGLLH